MENSVILEETGYIYISPYHESVIKYTSNYTGYPITNSCLIKI